uniref:SFRICE_031600 n=1 Tax=Spodoptera frugiperda TaxID=7108 RepID=A0A2H1X0H5_SPOFR
MLLEEKKKPCCAAIKALVSADPDEHIRGTDSAWEAPGHDTELFPVFNATQSTARVTLQENLRNWIL